MHSLDVVDFSNEWIAAWNSHDLPRILSHYSDDFEMSSPYIAQIAGEPSGTLKGKLKVGAYWQNALQHFPRLHFELVEVLMGVSSLAMYYKSNVANRMVLEVLSLDEQGRIVRGHAHNSLSAEKPK